MGCIGNLDDPTKVTVSELASKSLYYDGMKIETKGILVPYTIAKLRPSQYYHEYMVFKLYDPFDGNAFIYAANGLTGQHLKSDRVNHKHYDEYVKVIGEYMFFDEFDDQHILMFWRISIVPGSMVITITTTE
jgi:hypothetical protein